MGSPYVLIKAHSARPTDAIGKKHRASRRQGFMRARARATQKASDDRFGGEMTSHCYSGGGASAPTPDLLALTPEPEVRRNAGDIRCAARGKAHPCTPAR